MLEKYLDNKTFLYYFTFFLGSLTVFSFQPFNFTLINFIILPIFLFNYLYIKKSKSTYEKIIQKNLCFGTSFGFGYYLSGNHGLQIH